ncbi:hypothetical protein BV898_12858 [Hypsibius exemplaris]|uniref:Invertebrate defensins family profile domain-containing protein n=1 Tax=Hypsibius exemplaris TaxID=2072580 RepID=A0A1W0WCP2_HYPEX|nr:hypothetical protein BV898_12858 [Hypsibius exemplaris]
MHKMAVIFVAMVCLLSVLQTANADSCGCPFSPRKCIENCEKRNYFGGACHGLVNAVCGCRNSNGQLVSIANTC